MAALSPLPLSKTVAIFPGSAPDGLAKARENDNCQYPQIYKELDRDSDIGLLLRVLNWLQAEDP